MSRGDKAVNRTTKKSRHTYQIIHSLLRVIRNGIECKTVVDDVIDACDAMINIRENIHDIYQRYQNEKDPETASLMHARGIVALQKYFDLILFQSYLDSNPPGISSELLSFTEWVRMHPEISTINETLQVLDPHPLSPVSENLFYRSQKLNLMICSQLWKRNS